MATTRRNVRVGKSYVRVVKGRKQVCKGPRSHSRKKHF